MRIKKSAKRYKNTEHYQEIRQAETELDKRIKETNSQFLKQRNKRIKEFLQKLADSFYGLWLLALIAFGLFPLCLFLLLLLIGFGFTFPFLAKIYFLLLFPLSTWLGTTSWFSWLSLSWGRWFSDHFDFTRQEQSHWLIRTKSAQGFLFLLLPLLLNFGLVLFLIFRIYPTVFSILLTRLGIASWLGLPLLITTCFGSLVNLPLFVLKAHRQSERRVNFELLPLWLLKCWYLPSYPTRYPSLGYIGINISGGLIPILLALYQVHRAQPFEILVVTAIVGLMSYFLVTVIPGRAIIFRESRFWLIAVVAALSAMTLVAPGANHRTDVSVAFAGGVLGTIIGADLLHLKDVAPPENAVIPLNPCNIGNIGGAGLHDGILQCGLYALIIAEWLPAALAWILAQDIL
jgi:uncharacterized membrane protein